MKKEFLLPLILLCSIQINAQSLDKLRLMCIDEINISQYAGNLSSKELENQISVLGFRYIEEGQIKYHKELIVYDCNTGEVKFTALFDQNRLYKEFVLYEAKDMPAKKLYFAKNNPSPYVDLSLKFKGQTIPAYPIGQAEIYSKGQLRQTIQFSQEAGLPFVVNYDKSKNKISEGNATITGQVQQNWTVSKRGEWKYFENGQISSTSIYDPKGNISSEKLYNNGTITVENKFLPNGATEISSFYPNGKIKEKGLQKGKSKIGTWTYFTAEGKLATKIEYKNGREVFKVVQDDLGNIAKEIELVTDKSELPKSLNTLEEVYETRTYYSNSTVKTRGFESAAKKSGHI